MHNNHIIVSDGIIESLNCDRIIDKYCAFVVAVLVLVLYNHVELDVSLSSSLSVALVLLLSKPAINSRRLFG